jgi:hypothetical protein
MSPRHDEKGGSTLSNIFWLAALAAFAYGAWNFVPAYYAHYQLQDKALEYCRIMPSPTTTNEIIMQKIMRDVRDLGLAPYVFPANIKIDTRENSRGIKIEYQRDIPIFPGYKYHWNKPIAVDAPWY